MIGIIAAMDKEIKTLLKAMTIDKTDIIANKSFYRGFLGSQEVVVTQSGIGKVNAAMTTTILLMSYPIDYLINTGVAGGLFPINSGDIIVSEGVVYSDVDVQKIDPELPYGQMPGDPFIVYADARLVSQAKDLLKERKLCYRSGIIASGDQFITDSIKLAPIQSVVNDLYAVEMESMAIAMTAMKFHIPFVIFRGISDVIDDTLQVQMYENTVEDIADLTADFVIQYVERYPWKPLM